MMDRQTIRVAALYALGLGGGLGLAVAAKALGPPGSPVAITGFVVAMAWGLVFGSLAWRKTDEPAREAHKFAAFWGAPFGLLAVVAVLLAMTPDMGVAGPFHLDFSKPERLTPGVMLAAIVQIVGYVLAWAGWWMRRR